jgi:hypothetical protein
MHLGHAQYLPVAPPMFALLAGTLVLLLILIQIQLVLKHGRVRKFDFCLYAYRVAAATR